MFCGHCGSELPDSVKFCPNCGAPIEKKTEIEVVDNSYTDNSSSTSYSSTSSSSASYSGTVVGSRNGISSRSIALAIILTIITCGIYGVYWFIKLTDETNQLSGEYNGTSGLMAVVLCIVTCGIYGLYWSYKLGSKVDRIKGVDNGDTGILYIVLQLLGVGIINYALAQDTINKTVE